MRARAALAGALAALALAVGATAAGGDAADPPSVVLVTRDCSMTAHICPGFVQAARRTGTRARVVSPDRREDIDVTFAVLADQGYT